MRILFLVPYTPNLIRVRPYNLIRALAARGNDVTILTLTTNEIEQEQAAQLGDYGEVISYPLPRYRSLTNALLALPGRTPLQAVYCWHPGLAARLLHLVQEDHYDVLHVEHLRGARYGVHLCHTLPPPARPPVVWDSVDCITALFRQAATHSKSLPGRLITRLELQRTAHYERWLLQQFEQVLVTSPADRRQLLDLAQGAPNPSPITVVPNGVDRQEFYPDPHNPPLDNTLVFSGKMSYHANITMALFLANDIMPLVWATRPDVRLTIVGKDPPREIQALANLRPPNASHNPVTVTGSVPSLRPYLQQATIAIAPLRYGAGIQNKILEAMACGAPVVTTSTALRALHAAPNRDLLVADDAPQFASAILDLLSNPQRRRQIAAAGLQYVRTHHHWDAIAARLEDIYRQSR